MSIRVHSWFKSRPPAIIRANPCQSVARKNLRGTALPFAASRLRVSKSACKVTRQRSSTEPRLKPEWLHSCPFVFIRGSNPAPLRLSVPIRVNPWREKTSVALHSPSRLRVTPADRKCSTRGLPSAARPHNTEHRTCAFPFAPSRLRVSPVHHPAIHPCKSVFIRGDGIPAIESRQEKAESRKRTSSIHRFLRGPTASVANDFARGIS